MSKIELKTLRKEATLSICLSQDQRLLAVMLRMEGERGRLITLTANKYNQDTHFWNNNQGC